MAKRKEFMGDLSFSPTEGVRLVDDYIRWILAKEGCLYCWPHPSNNYSGKDLSIAKYKNVYDCSGLVTSGIFAVTMGAIDLRSNGNCQWMWDNLERADGPGKGRLAIYGTHKRKTHVMTCLEDGRVFGAAGGDETTLEPEVGLKNPANVRFAASPGYRRDLRGFVLLPFATR